MVALERHCTHIGLYLYHHRNKLHAAVPNVGLLLIWFGLCSLFLASKVTVARLLNSYNRSNPSVRDLLDHTPNLRTIIVIADIYRGLYSPAQHINTLDPPYLTFRHRSGVTPYTSTFVFAGSCVFGKQSAGNLSLRPQYIRRCRGRPYP